MVDAIGQKYVPLWLLEVLKLWRRHRADRDAEMDFMEAIAALERRLSERRRK